MPTIKSWTTLGHLGFNPGVNRALGFGLATLTVTLAAKTASSVQAAPADDYRTEIRPNLEKHCYECHGPEKAKAKLNLAFRTKCSIPDFLPFRLFSL